MIFLASPYSHSSWIVQEQRYLYALHAIAHLLKEDKPAFSPIVYCHEMAKAVSLPKSAPFWAAFNERMIRLCEDFYVLRIDGWQESVGVANEIIFAQSIGRIVIYY